MVGHLRSGIKLDILASLAGQPQNEGLRPMVKTVNL